MKEQARGALDKLQRQRQRLKEALEMVRPWFPLDASLFEGEMDSAQAMYLDAFRARFAELQDYLGQRIFRLIALVDQDESPALPLSTRERVQLMERKGLLSRRQWLALRDLRNDFTHEYPDEAAEKADNLNRAFALAPSLLAVAENAQRYLHDALESAGD